MFEHLSFENKAILMHRSLLVLLSFVMCGCLSTKTSVDKQNAFSFALVGDMPYYPRDVGKFERLIAEVNAEPDIKWVLHAGDIKRGDQPCTDAFLEGRLALYQQFEQPFIFTPGDNEWTDCHREGAGQFKPLERLAKLRSLFYPEPGLSLGKNPMPLKTQAEDPAMAEFPENVLWVENEIVFASVHIVGSKNGMADFAGRTQEDDAEVARRTDAAIEWIRMAFEEAEQLNSPGIFFMIHANPGFSAAPEFEAFQSFLNVLTEETLNFGKPVVLAHGDSHYFRIDKPLIDPTSKQRIANFTRVETFGAGDVHWLQITVNPADENVFIIKQEIVRENLGRR